jgi:hypothetical protein
MGKYEIGYDPAVWDTFLDDGVNVRREDKVKRSIEKRKTAMT